MEVLTSLVIFLAFSCSISGNVIEDAVVQINTSSIIANTDANYICATIDWWPPNKCDYNKCVWGSSSLLNLDLNHPLLIKAIQAFKNLRIRLGGSLQDQVHYHIVNPKSPCVPFKKEKGGLFGFSKGCLHVSRWDELNIFFKNTSALVTFGLNALYGRHKAKKGTWVGNWSSTNARELIAYTISKGYKIDSWEFGNELSGKGIGANVGAEQYGKDVINLNAMIQELYKNIHPKPLILAPGGFYDANWFAKFLRISGPGVIDVMTHHIYNLGSGNDPKLVKRILDPEYLSKVSNTFSNLSQTIQRNGPWAYAWIGEAGGAYNSGGLNVSDTFVNSFWYLDQLGMAAKFDTKVYCRQTLIGGNYGLLNKSTFLPNPDYYSALMWHRLMGKGVLAAHSNASYLRSYAHCSKERTGVTLLLINLSNQTEYQVQIDASSNNSFIKGKPKRKSFVNVLKKTVSWIGTKASDEALFREEYHLTPKDGDIRSKIMMLNGEELKLNVTGYDLIFSPAMIDLKSQVTIAPLSIKFIVLPNVNTPCRT